MLTVVKIDKEYIETPKKSELTNNNNIFSQMLDSMSATYKDTSFYLYDSEIQDYKQLLLNIVNKKFKTNFKTIIDYEDDIRLLDDMLICTYDEINKLSTINTISKLSTMYRDVYVFNTILDNPFDNMFYIVCIGKNTEKDSITTNDTSYITNINKNKQILYTYLYTCYSKSLMLFKAIINKDDKILKNYKSLLLLLKQNSK